MAMELDLENIVWDEDLRKIWLKISEILSILLESNEFTRDEFITTNLLWKH